jgi:hypothetical protein
MAKVSDASPRVFISYSYDSEDHMERTLRLSDRLITEGGLDCWIDQYEQSPEEGWATWCEKQILDAIYVLVVCTPEYRRRFDRVEPAGSDHGVKWEGAIITQVIYNDGRNRKFIPVVFADSDAKSIPLVMQGYTFYNVSTEKGYTDLYRRLTNQPRVVRPTPGKIVKFPPELKSSFAADVDALRSSADLSGRPAQSATGVRPSDENVARTMGHAVSATSKRASTKAGRSTSERGHRIKLGVLQGPIEEPRTFAQLREGEAVDAISVGIYLGVSVKGAALALDRAISQGPVAIRRSLSGDISEPELVLTQLVERGVLRGELGRIFCVPDPRPDAARRVIAVVGMGLPGFLNPDHLTGVVRSLCWTLGRIGCRHLATVLIGSGGGNFGTEAAVAAWLRGLTEYVVEAAGANRRRLQRITLVAADPREVDAIHTALQLHVREHRDDVDFLPIGAAKLDALRVKAREHDRLMLEQRLKQSQAAAAPGREPFPTRLRITLERDSLHISGITETQVIQDRVSRLDPRLLEEACKDLISARGLSQQLERGQFLGRLLIPMEVWALLRNGSPIVLHLDAPSASVPWEMIVPPDAVPDAVERTSGIGDAETSLPFLGIRRAVTRQLRTNFDIAPAPPSPPRHILRVLVVADMSEEHRLPGAELEGVEVAELFASFNAAYERLTQDRVEVVQLIGPRDATRTNVLRYLLLRSFDVLHVAGHGFFDPKDPGASGWVFGRGELLTPRELSRIDSPPRFIFANTSETGVIAGPPPGASEAHVPSFAETLLASGVSNFVGAAWPMNDASARSFALTLYSGLLGLAGTGERCRPAPMIAMQEAMRRARLDTARGSERDATWGCYHHYGDPFCRFFDPERIAPSLVDGPQRPQATLEHKPATNKSRKRRTVKTVRKRGSDRGSSARR